MIRSIASALAAVARPALLRLEPELAHHLALRGLELMRAHWRIPAPAPELAVTCLGLRFAHPVGLAAGFDKNGDYLDALGAIGFSHIEVGTVTPRPQPGNPRPRLFRIREAQAIVNRMGFNNEGVDHLVRQLERSTYRGVRGVSIGKNADTPLERAEEDYVTCFRKVYALADYVAVNVSSPNTLRLRELQSGEGLERIVTPLLEERVRLSREHGKHTPLLVKLAPDLSDEELPSVARELRRLGVDGVIATNTTVQLDGVPGILPKHHGGGLSGAPLHARSVAVISRLRSELGPDFPIIGVGGIMSARAALETLAAGANLIQIYTGFVYRGPDLLFEILRALSGERRAVSLEPSAR